MECSCHRREVNRVRFIKFCPLHAAAEGLLAFAQMIANGGLDSGATHEEIEVDARAAIAEAEGK